MGTEVISSGGTLFGGGIGSGGTTILESGAVEVDALEVYSGGSLVGSGGIVLGSATIFGAAIGVVVSSGGTMAAIGGGGDVSTFVETGGVENVSSGGTTTGTVLSGSTSGSFPQQNVYNSGVTTSTYVSNFSRETVYAGGTAIGTTLTAVLVSGTQHGNLAVSSGGTALNTNVLSGGGEWIGSGGTGLGDTIFSAGYLSILTGGTELGATVSSGGTAMVSSGALVSGTTVIGGWEFVSSGGIVNGAVLLSGGSEVVSSGGSVVGTIVGNSALEIVSANAAFLNTVVSNGGGQEILAGGIASGSTVLNGGNETIASGGIASGSIISSGGIVGVSSGGEAVATIIAGGSLVLSGGALTSGGITFLGSGGVLDIENANALPGSIISGFTAGNKIDLEFLSYASSDTYSVSGDVVTISAGSGTYALTIAGATSGGYALAADTDGTLELIVCYYPGTLIRTESGDRAVETLVPGTRVITADGRALPIRWVGRNTVSTRFADPLRVLPIRIRAGALADNCPERDLLVSPDHAVLVDTLLIQAGAIVNGLSIVRESNVPEVFTYYHIELCEHTLILAEGAAAETFVDNVNRTVFDNWEEHEALYNDISITEMEYPRVQSYRQLPVETRATLMARACRYFSNTKREVA